MRQKLLFILLILVLIGTTQFVNGFNYMYFSETETTVFGEESRLFFGDTLWGAIRTNGCFQCMQGGHNNVYGLIMMSCTDEETNCDDGLFAHDNVYTGVPVLPFPENADPLRERALWNGSLFDAPDNALAYVTLLGSVMRIRWGTQGTPLDTLTAEVQSVNMIPNGVYFFECPIRIHGEISLPRIVIASSGDIGLVDDVRYSCLDPNDYYIPLDCNDMLALVAEGDVVIMNTWANGRDNRSQGSDIVICALVVALGESFTFDQQNDNSDTYIGPTPDERGGIHLRGALANYRHGYVHRSNNGGTGYLKDYDFDERLLQWDIGLFHDEPPLVDPPELEYGEVVVGETVWDTLTIRPLWMPNYSGTFTTQPFYSPPVFYPPAAEFRIPVSFSPSRVGNYNGYVYFYLDGVYHSVEAHGIGINPPESIGLTASAHPNPFNAVTTLSLVLPQSGELKITLFDLLGRKVEQLSFNNLPAGQQQLRLDMLKHSSGVYFAQLRSGQQITTHKLLLMK